LRDHILTEAIAKSNGILEHCMYCNDVFGPDDKWKLLPHWFSSYISVTCSCCKREHRFKDSTIHTIDDLIERINKK
jgi:RNase P subunit RPR2